MADKEALLHDIEIVTTFSSKYDMKKPEQAGKYVTFFESKNYFVSGVGTSYIERLKEIRQGKINEPCFVCKKNPSYDGVLCTGCMNKYSRGKKQFYGQNDLADLNVLFSSESVDNIKSKSQGTVNQLKAAKDAAMSKASDISGKVQNRLQEEDVQKVKEKIIPTINAASENAKKFAKDNNIEGKVAVAKDQANKAKKEAKHLWGRMSRVQKIAVTVVAVVLIISGVGGILSFGRAKIDIISYIGCDSKSIFMEFDKTQFHTAASGLGIIKNGNPTIAIRFDTDKVQYVDLSSEYKGYEKYCLCGIKIGDSKKTVSEKLAKINGNTISQFADNNGIMFKLSSGYVLNIGFDENGIVKFLRIS